MFSLLLPFNKTIRRLLVSAALVTVVEWATVSPSVQAEPNPLILTLEISGQPERGELARQAEALAIDEITNQFAADPTIDQIRVSVLGQYNGRIAPILETTVLRADWVNNSRIDVQSTQYYYTSYALLGLQPGNGERTPAAVAQVPQFASLREYQDPVVRLQQAAREGRLSRSEYIELVDALD